MSSFYFFVMVLSRLCFGIAVGLVMFQVNSSLTVAAAIALITYTISATFYQEAVVESVLKELHDAKRNLSKDV